MDGAVKASVYGGGKIARVEKNSSVTIGFKFKTGQPIIGEPIIKKNVFGAGMGAPTHGYAGLVRGNSSVTIQGKSKVEGSVYGGGLQASIGRYFLALNEDLADAHDVEIGMPYDIKSGGKATVIVQDDAEIGPDDMLMTASGGPQDAGHVFGAGKGTSPYESNLIGRYYIDEKYGYIWEDYSYDHDAYIKFIETLGITDQTEVTIGGNAFIKGSVYGGSENGYVRTNTHVTIQDNCQIGNGLVQMDDDGNYLDTKKSVNRRYVKAAALLNMKTIILIAAAKELGINTSGYSSATTDDEKEAALESIKEAIIENSDRFDMQAVYGGGNLAPYIYGYYNGYYQKTDKTIAKTDTKMVETARTEVIIDGCDYSSIKTVYGGGNAAPVSGTFVEVNGTYDIYEVFGGGKHLHR